MNRSRYICVAKIISMQFWITIDNDRRQLRYKVDFVPVNDRLEYFRVKGGNGSVVFSSNRPLYRSRGVRKRQPDILLVEGRLSNLSVQRKIVEALQEYIRNHM
jgi:hypothetical protein